MTEQQEERLKWFTDAKFGMFIHWGAYAIPARCEWIMCIERVPVEEYEKWADAFNPRFFDARAWAETAKRAGMKYMVLTTKHHDGFCLFDTETTDYSTVKRGAKRDFVAEYVEACREAGMKIGFYFSLLDWHHPDWQAHCTLGDQETWSGLMPDDAMRRYVEYHHEQVRELCTNYGKIDVMWYDGCWYSADVMQSEKLNAMVRELQPHIIINNRANLPADFDTPEQQIIPSEPGRAWESCMTMNDHWGAFPEDQHWKSVKDLVLTLTKTTCGGGNLLLNVGPRADGTFPPESVERLEKMGEWLSVNGEAFYGTEPGPDWLVSHARTQKGGTVYLHLPYWWGEELVIFPGGRRILSAKLLADGRELKVDQRPDRTFLKGMPRKDPDPIGSVIAMQAEQSA